MQNTSPDLLDEHMVVVENTIEEAESEELTVIEEQKEEEQDQVRKNVLKISRAVLFAIIYFISSISLTIYIKHVVSYTSFHFPLTFLTLQHFMYTIVCYILVNYVIPLVYQTQVFTFSYKQFKRLIPFGFMTGLDYGLANISFLFVTVTLYTMIKCSVPVFVMLLSFLIRIEKPRKVLIVSIVLISVGVGMSARGSVDLNLIGIVLVLGSSIVGAFRLVYVQTVLQRKSVPIMTQNSSDNEVGNVEAFLYSAPTLAVAILPFALALEGPKILLQYMQLPVAGTATIPFQRIGFMFKFIALASAGAVFGFCLNLSEYFLIRETSSLTYTAVGVLKELLVIAASVIIFGDTLTFTNVVGYSISVLGIGLFKLYRLSTLLRSSRKTAEPTEIVSLIQSSTDNLDEQNAIAGTDKV